MDASAAREAAWSARRISRIIGVSTLVISLATLVASRLLLGAEVSGMFVVEVASTALLAGSLGALVFASLSSRETEKNIEVSLQSALRETLTPLASALGDDAWAGYRWYTHFAPAVQGDGFPNHAVQAIRFGYTRSGLQTSKISLVCIGSLADEARRPYEDTDRYLMRWQIEEDLDPSDIRVFNPARLMVDQKIVKPKLRQRLSDGVRVAEYEYDVRSLRSSGRTRIDVSLITRKALQTPTLSRTILHRSVTDAEFTCTVDRSLEATKVDVAANVTGLGPNAERFSGELFPGLPNSDGCMARFGYPILAGGSVTFFIDFPVGQ
jgi:hypothetical protein